MRILVSGGAGFIGSHLCESLLKDGHKVICVDNLITGARSNIVSLLSNKDFNFLEHDIREKLELDGMEMIFNLACPASPIDYQEIPLDTLWVSALGTKNMLDLAKKNRAVFVHASTSEIYGDPLEHPQKESYFGNVNCIGPRSCYDEGKRFAESLIANYQKKYGLETKIVRIFNTYGPKMRRHDGRVIPNFINQALEGRDITVNGDGSQTRSFCYISDMIEGIKRLEATPDFSGPVNIGNPQEYSIKQLAELTLELIGSKSAIIFNPLPQDDPKVRCPDISLARKVLGFEPSVRLAEGLQKTIDWFRVGGA